MAALEPYRLEDAQETGRELGHGSYAAVVEVVYKGLRCAGKKIHRVLYVERVGDLVRRFESECRLLSQLRHPHIVQFLGVYFERGMNVPVLVMELLPITLAQCLDRYGVLPNEISYSVLYDVVLGLRYLHGQVPPIIHRDLSANNVLLTSDMTAKITDLGVAKIVNLTPAQLTRMTQAPGTPCYMPPEALIPNPSYTASIDTYSYGILMIHAFSGRWPFPSEASRLNPNNPDELLPVSEAERRQVYLDDMGRDHPLMRLTLQCVSNNPSHRPTATEIHQQVSEVSVQFPASFANKVEMLQRIQAISEEKQALQTEVEWHHSEAAPLRDEIEDLQLTSSVQIEGLQLEVAELKASLAQTENELRSEIRAKEVETAANQEEYRIQISAKEAVIAVQEEEWRAMEASKNSIIASKDTIIASKEDVIASKASALARKDATISSLSHQMGRLQQNIVSKEMVKVKLPVKLKPSHHILFTFYHISCDVQKVTKSTKGASKQPPVEAVVGYAWIPLLDSDGRVLGGLHNLPVAANLPPGYLALSQPETARGTANPDIRWVDGHKPIFRVSLKLDSTIYTQDPDLHTFFSLCEHLDTFGVEGSLQAALKSLSSLELATIIQFLPVILSQLFRLLSLSSKELEGVKPDVLRQLLLLVEKVANADRTELLRSYIEYMFVTEVDSSKKRGVHDELARLLVQCLRQQDPLVVPKLLDHLWFFLEVMLKSMAQFLTITKKMASSRKTRYPEDFGWNLQSFITILLTHIRERFSDLVAKRANRSLADFVKCLFSFMDRGVVFKIVARYLEGFSVSEHLHLSELKLEFLRIVCDHEHFVALNLPFPVAPENMEYSLTDEFCRKHFLAGVLLREVQSALEYEAGPVRRRSIRVLRNLLAKHDCDPRYADPGQKARIAALYFPLIPLVLDHVTRLDPGTTPYISPMLNATSMASFQARTAVKGIDSIPPSLTGTLDKEKGGVGMERGTFSNSDLPSAITSKFSPSKGLGGTLSSSGAPSLPRIESEMSLDPETSMTSDNIPPPSPLEQTMLELDKLSVEETRDLLVSTLFVLKYLDTAILLHWWRECMGPSEGGLRWSTYKDTFPALFSRLLDFFDLLESCLYTFKYTGRRAVALKISTQASVMREPVDSLQGGAAGAQPQQGGGGGGGGKEKKKYSSVTIGSNSGAAPSKGKIPSRSTSLSTVSTGTSSLPHSPLPTLPTSSSEEVEVGVKVEGALANEVGLIILSLLDSYTNNFRKELCQDEGDNILMVKYFSLLVTFLQVTQSATLQSHVFAVVKAFIHKFMEALFKGSPEYCGILCYELLQCCNSRLPSIRIEATALVYLLMRCNFEYFKGRGFVRTHLQSTIAVSKVVSTLLGQSDSNLRRTLTAIASYSSQDERVQGTPFPAEVKDLMRRLKTVLSSTAQMKAHQFDPEKLVDLHYSLAKSYGNSPELRHVWLDSMAVLHLKYGNYSEAAHCCIHIAGLVAQYLKIKGQYPAGCAAFRQISPNVELEESGIKEDRETAEEQQFTEHNLVSLLESSINYLEQAQRYEVMAEVYKLLQPFYEKARDFKHMMEMYGKLHEAFRKVVSIMTTGRRYLGTYFRVAFFGRPFGDDHERQYIYKEPNVTTLAELTLRLQKLYSRKFGSTEIVHIIQESVKVNPASLDLDHAHIQITHTEPYFTTEELEEEHRTRFERQNKISRFVFETPFTQDGRTHGDVTKQCIRKTILTTSHWFPYVKKRILVIDVEQFELKPVEVAIEAMEKKTNDLAAVVRMEPPDLKRLQLLLQGSISTQVNQGVQEYAAFLKEPQASAQSGAHTEKLREVYRSFMEVCQDALELNGRLISTDQLLYHEELRNKFQQIQTFLGPILNIKERPVSPSSPTDTLPRRSITRVDPHRMSAVLFHSISGNK